MSGPVPPDTVVIAAYYPNTAVVCQPCLGPAFVGTPAIQGPPGASFPPQTFPVMIGTAGQTAIPLPMPPAVPSSLRLIVNGAVFVAPDLVLGPTSVTWVNPDFILEPTDAVTLSFV